MEEEIPRTCWGKGSTQKSYCQICRGEFEIGIYRPNLHYCEGGEYYVDEMPEGVIEVPTTIDKAGCGAEHLVHKSCLDIVQGRLLVGCYYHTFADFSVWLEAKDAERIWYLSEQQAPIARALENVEGHSLVTQESESLREKYNILEREYVSLWKKGEVKVKHA